MSDKKQSSVKWLANQSYELFEQYSEGNFDRINLNKLMLKATEQARAKHKVEIMQSLNDGKSMALGTMVNTSLEQYYNEIYGGNNE